MEQEKFTSLSALYQKVYPALKARVTELHKLKMVYILEDDIWEALREYKWNNTTNLTLHDIVDDILHVDAEIINKYVRNKRKNGTT